jgi:hypothetical protein
MMAARARVHEIANSFGIDSKTALRMLKEDGEYVKGPSSSIVKAVELRLIARLVAEGHVRQADGVVLEPTSKSEPTQAIPASPRPTPGPPGTVWTATEPFVAYRDPTPPPTVEPRVASANKAPRVTRAPRLTREEQQAAHKADLLERERQALISSIEAGKRTEASRRKVHHPADPAASQRQEELVATDVALSVLRAKQLAARAEVVAARRRATIAAEQAATADRESMRANNPRPPRVFDEEKTRRAARRAVVSRSERDWQSYGFTKQERAKWETAGLRPDQAHIPAMCRAFGRPDWRIEPNHLGVALRNGRTVLEEFNVGSNVVQVMDQLALIRPKGFRGAYGSRVAAILPVLRDFAPEKRVRSVTFPDDLTATGVPKIADYILHLLRPSSDESLVDTFNRERRVAIRNASFGGRAAQRQGQLAQLYAEAHGVFDDWGLAETLLNNLPMHVSERRLPISNLIHDAIRERQFYYLSESASLSVEAAADGRIQVPEEYHLPSPTGFAVLSSNHELDDDDRILIWSHGADQLAAALLSIADVRAGALGNQVVASAQVGDVPGDDKALALTTAIAGLIRRPPHLAADERVKPVRPRVAAPTERPLRGPAGGDANADHVSLLYAPGETRWVDASQGTGRKADHRWVVRGHWRQQPYPSTGEIRPVYIKPHESGSPDGDLWVTDRVRIPRVI